MPKVRKSQKPKVKAGSSSGVQVVPREYAGKWIAWSADGRRIIAVGDGFQSCEQAAARAGVPADQIAIERVPEARYRLSGSGT
ncbi:MAG: hypothetical protein ACP5XB_31165 [Isosphaeraceae bacterium]